MKSKSGVRVLSDQKSPLEKRFERASFNNPGDFLLSHTVSRAVPSAPAGLTSVFGMGTGVTLPTKSPENFFGSGGPSLVALRRKSKKLSPPLRSGYCPASAPGCQ